jgi:predicted lysophospholipase L1 biosynthesis ABC-type transport system permease subunit
MMYAFAMMALLGLAVLAVAAVADRYLSIAAEVRAFVLAALGVGAAWLVNLDLFGVLAVATRGSAIGVTVTGLMIGGAAYFWQEILGFFAGLTRKLGGEAATLEKSEQLRRVA